MQPIPIGEFRAQIIGVYQDLDRAPGTIQKIDMVLRELEEVGAATTADITTTLVARWRKQYRAQRERPAAKDRELSDRSANTVFGLVSVMRAAASYAIDEGYLDRPPNWKLVRPRVPKHVEGKHLPWDDVAKLLTHLEAKAARPGTWCDRRALSLVATVAYTGIRRNEALYLRVEDVDLETGIVWLKDIPERRLKTVGSGLPVPAPPELAAILKPWIAQAETRWVFPGIRTRRPWHGGGPGSRPIDVLQAAATDAEVTRHTTFHGLRHSWATHAETLWGFTDAQIQRVLRHTQAATTARYKHADLVNLAKLGSRVTFRRPADGEADKRATA